MSAEDPFAPAGAASTAVSGPVASLARLLPQLPGARWVALAGEELVGCPASVTPPRGASELARRAVASGRVSRLARAARRDDGTDEELIAVPAGSIALLALVRGADEGSRREIVRRARAVLGGGGRVAPPAPARSPSVRAVPSRAAAAEVRSADDARSAPTGFEASALAVLDAAAEHGERSACALALADSLATQARCARVAVGVHRRGRTRLLAISGETRPDARRALTRRIESVMAEALARGRDVVWPLDGSAGDAAADPGTTVGTEDEGSLRAHRRQHALEGLTLCSLVPETSTGDRLVVVLERAGEWRPDPAWRVAVSRAIAPSLTLIARLGRANATPLERLRDRLTSVGRLRPSHRLGIAALAGVTLCAGAWVPLPYRISARVLIEASDRQVLAAAHAGHLRSAHARAGDDVRAGQLLATLDDRELLLDRDRWDGEASRNRAEQARALATHDRIELARLRADAARIETERALIEERRARGELRAPFDGIVLSGDPGRALGAPVETGEVLFEVASSDRRSLLVEVAEHDIAQVPRDASARVRMAAEPRRVLAARLGPVVPVAVAEPGGSVFRVPATLLDAEVGDSLKPGMQGVARIDAGRRPLLDAWTRALRERALLLAWKLGFAR